MLEPVEPKTEHVKATTEPLPTSNVESMPESLPTSKTRSGRKAIPAALKRLAWSRDEGRCQYVDPQSGRKCEGVYFLDFEHLVPVAIQARFLPRSKIINPCTIKRSNFVYSLSNIISITDF